MITINRDQVEAPDVVNEGEKREGIRREQNIYQGQVSDILKAFNHAPQLLGTLTPKKFRLSTVTSYTMKFIHMLVPKTSVIVTVIVLEIMVE